MLARAFGVAIVPRRAGAETSCADPRLPDPRLALPELAHRVAVLFHLRTLRIAPAESPVEVEAKAVRAAPHAACRRRRKVRRHHERASIGILFEK